MKHLVGSILVILFYSAAFSTENPVLKKDAHRMVQIIPEGEDFHDDGTNLTRYPPYAIFTTEGDLVMNIPESINKPHVIEILPGTYMVEFKRDGEIQKALLEVDTDSFQRFRM
jgi:hypothetical protein